MPEVEVPEQDGLWGDINGSGNVDINDVQLLYNLLEAGEAAAAYDLNGDGTLDQVDLDCLFDAVLNPETTKEGGKMA